MAEPKKLNTLSIEDLTKGLSESQMKELYPKIAEVLKLPVDNQHADAVKALGADMAAVKTDIETVKNLVDIIDKAWADNKLPAEKSKASGFSGLGEMVKSVASFREGGGMDERLKPFQKAAGTGNDALTPAGGQFLVPDDLKTDMLGMIPQASPILSRCTPVPVNGLKVNYPAYVDYDRSSALYFGGVSVSYRKEKTQITGTAPTFGEISLEPLEIVGMTAPTLELINMSAVSLEPILNRMFAFAIAKKKEKGIISGKGNGEPLGLLNAPCKYAVTTETGQGADVLWPANIIKMIERMPSESSVSPCWIFHPLMLSYLVLAKEEIGLAGELVKWFDFGNRTLMGYPYFPSNFCSAPGTEGDIFFTDLTFYLNAFRVGGDMYRTSDDFYFDYVQRALQVITTFDGQPWWKTTLLLEDGTTYVSPVVTLATRA